MTKLAFFLGVMFLASLGCAESSSLPEAPQVQARNHVVSVTLHAVNENGRDAFAFNGEPVAPVIRASPGDVLKITYINDLPSTSSEKCAINPCMDMTNLHFHGLTVSPHAPQDDVLTMLAMPGQVLHYSVRIPRDHPPGLFWYHTHPHGESHRQVLDGMSGAIVIEGMERYVPEVGRLRERVIRLKDPNCHAEYPPSRTRRLITNVRIADASGDTITVTANFAVYRYRRGEPAREFVGHYRHKLRRVGGVLKFAERRAILDAHELGAMGSVSFIL